MFLAGKLIPRQPLADDLADGKVKPFAVVHLAVIEAIHLLIQVAEEKERFDRNVGSAQAAL
jgi:hypothetical protein